MFGRKAAKIRSLMAENEALRAYNTRLLQLITATAQWCPDSCCEFKHLKMTVPPVEQFVDSFLRYVEGQEPEEANNGVVR